jgi:hypothetical protein
MGGYDSARRNDVWRSTDQGATWTQITGAAPWTGRDSHTSVALLDGSIVLMGGVGNGFRNDVWLSTDNGATWSQLTAAAEWVGREGHTSVALPDGSIVLMGGNDGKATTTDNPRNDVWRSTDQGATWTLMTATAPWTGRSDHSSMTLPDGSIVLMGGRNFRLSVRFNDVWRSIDQGATWIRMTAAAPWTARDEHTSVVRPDGSIVLMGGYDGSTSLNDVWRSTDQGATWTQMTAAAGWTPRSSHTSVTLPDGSIVLIGGYYWDGSGNSLNDVWRSTDQGATWTQITTAAPWTGRYSHSSVTLPDGSIVLMAGDYVLYDVWRLETAGSTAQHPTHIYTDLGSYPVALQVYHPGGIGSLVKTAYIHVIDEETFLAYLPLVRRDIP